MGKHHSKLLILIIVLIASAGVIFVSQKMHTQSSSYVPAAAEAQEEPKMTSEISPDGKFALTMKEEKGEVVIKYTFLVTDSESNIKSQIFTKTVSSDGKMSIPTNTFSPDKKYVLLKEEDMGITTFWVLKTSGEAITEDSQALDISSLFMAKYTDYVVTDMTGWGGINLVVINTDKIGGGVGPSFWFDVPYKNFIQLSNRFN